MRTHLGINAKLNLVVELSGPRRHMCDGVVVFVREEGKFFGTVRPNPKSEILMVRRSSS
jgi:hypothetical protein